MKAIRLASISTSTSNYVAILGLVIPTPVSIALRFPDLVADLLCGHWVIVTPFNITPLSRISCELAFLPKEVASDLLADPQEVLPLAKLALEALFF